MSKEMHITLPAATINSPERERFVGWVERSETHHGPCRAEQSTMGFAALNPSYLDPSLRISTAAARTALMMFW